MRRRSSGRCASTLPFEVGSSSLPAAADTSSRSAEAPTQNLYLFIEGLFTSMPTMEVTEITIANIGGKTTAQVQLAFYLSPRLLTEEEGAD